MKNRVRRGFYRHCKGDTYFVVGVGILDGDGHGDPYAPWQVVYESTRIHEVGTAQPALRGGVHRTCRVARRQDAVAFRPRGARVVKDSDLKRGKR